MDAKKARTLEFRVSIRSVVLVVAVLAVLIVPVTWSVRQSRLTQEALDRARAAERTAVQAQTNAEEARDQVRGKAKTLRDEAIQRAARQDPKDAERVRQIYAELDTLMQIQERIQEDLRGLRRQTPKPTAATKENPRPEPKSDPGTGSP